MNVRVALLATLSVILVSTILSYNSVSEGSTESPTILDILECEEKYAQFEILGQYRFFELYSYSGLSTDCVLLYNDPIWEYDDDNRSQVLLQRLQEIHNEIDKSIISPQENDRQNLSIEKIGTLPTEEPGKFIYVFDICSVKYYTTISEILLVSDTEEIELMINYVLAPSSCLKYDVPISADNPGSIRVSSISVDQVVNVTELQEENDYLKKKIDEKDIVIVKQMQTMMAQVNTLLDLAQRLG